jgi:elongation factor Tu
MITGAAQMDGAILVISATDGPMPQTKEHLLLAKQVGVKYFVVFINRFDDNMDADLLELIKEDVKDNLKKYGYDAEKVPFVVGSALYGLEGIKDGDETIEALLKAMDETIPQPERELDKPFLMPVEDVFNIVGRGTVATGRIERGVVKVGDVVQQVGLNENVKEVTITGVEMFKKSLQQGQAGDNVGLLIRGIAREDIQRGQVLSAKGSIKPHTKCKAQIFVLTKEEGGRHTGFGKGYKPQFYIKTADVTGEVVVPEGKVVLPGDNADVEIHLIEPVAIEPQMSFAIREGGRTVGAGIITEIIE